MRFELTVLGTSAATPAYDRFCTAQLLRLETRHVLIDCGEGTQIQLQRAGLSHGKISLVLISHLHGDHYFGLPGLLTSMILNGRKTPLRIISPPGLRERLAVLIEFDVYELPFKIIFEEVISVRPTEIYRDKHFTVDAFPLQHRLPTNGFLIREAERQANIRPEAIKEYGIPFQQIPAIKAGGDFMATDGRVIPHAELTTPPIEPRAYAFCSDTRYFPELADFVKDVDLLYHEATFLHKDLENAVRTMHSTAREAGQTARDAGAKQLVIGHFSARYPNVTPLENEARKVFPTAVAARDLMRFVVTARSRKS